MSIINTGVIAKAMTPGVKRFFGLSYAEKAKVRQEVFKTETSARSYEEYVSMVGLGMLEKKSQGAPISFDSLRQGFTTRLTAETYALGYAITREAIQDNQYPELMKKYTAILAKAANATYETKGSLVLDRAFNSSYTGGDGKELCATDHPFAGNSGTWSNELSGNPDFSRRALEDMCIQTESWVDDKGIMIDAKLRKLVVPTALRFDVARVLSSMQEPGTANNDRNVITDENLQAVVWSYLSDTDAWFGLTDIEGLRMIDRESPMFDLDSDFVTTNLHYMVLMRVIFGWDDPRAIVGSQGS